MRGVVLACRALLEADAGVGPGLEILADPASSNPPTLVGKGFSMTIFENSTARKVVPPDRSAHVTASTSIRPATRLTYSLVLGSRDQVSVVIGDGSGQLRFLLERPDLTRLIEVLLSAACELQDVRGACS